MYCRKCGKKLKEKANFCTNCGTKVITNEIEKTTPVEKVEVVKEIKEVINSENNNKALLIVLFVMLSAIFLILLISILNKGII